MVEKSVVAMDCYLVVQLVALSVAKKADDLVDEWAAWWAALLAG
jgi:hypothetical protein